MVLATAPKYRKLATNSKHANNMNFFRLFEKIFRQKETMASETEDNNNVTRAWSIEQCNEEVDNSNKLETERNITVHSKEDDITNIDYSVVSIDEFGVTKTFYNLENVTPIEITTNDNIEQEPKANEISLIEDSRILNNVTGESLVVNNIEEKTEINNSDNDMEETQIRHDADAEFSNDNNNTERDTYNNVKDDETMQGLKEFEAALNNIEKPVLTDDFGIEIINLDDFNEIFNELDAVNEDLISVGNNIENNENGTCFKENITDVNNEIISILEDYTDIISINSSTEDEACQTEVIKYTNSINAVPDESNSDDGYNSSDFEFISETEANMAGFVINYGLENLQNLSGASSEPTICFGEENHQDSAGSDPGEGPSRQNRPRNEFEDRSYRNDHHVPIGDDYLGLFQGIYNPLLPMSDIIFLENKSVRASAMNMQYDGIGFDKQLAMRRHQPDSSEDEFEDEAKETSKKILNMYPGDNRKRRRRYL